MFPLPLAAADTIRILAFGDSLTAGYQLPPGADFASRLEAALSTNGTKAEVVNGGVSGDTATAGLARLDWSLNGDADEQVDGVILELGANDALRGIDPTITKDALVGIIETLTAKNIPVLLAGMLAPPNMGEAYGAAFNAIYPDLAKRYDVVFYPFFLDGVAAQPDLNLADGMHPNEAGIDVIVANILPSVEALVARIRDRQ